MRSMTAGLLDRRPRGHHLAVAATVVVAAVAASGCSQELRAVCPEKRENVVLVPSTSVSDLQTSKAMAPAVSEQVVARAAESCGHLGVGLQNNRTAADLDLQSVELTPKRTEAINPDPVIRKLRRTGTEFVQERLLDPLSTVPATDGSPFLGALVKLASELQAHDAAPATIVMLGDGIDIETSPSDQVVDFRLASTSKEVLDEFVPLLKPLAGSCVILMGAGAQSGLPDEVIRSSQERLRQTLDAAGVGFVATRSSDLPSTCGGTSS